MEAMKSLTRSRSLNNSGCLSNFAELIKKRESDLRFGNFPARCVKVCSGQIPRRSRLVTLGNLEQLNKSSRVSCDMLEGLDP